jgi:hypothetical protein
MFVNRRRQAKPFRSGKWIREMTPWWRKRLLKSAPEWLWTCKFLQTVIVRSSNVEAKPAIEAWSLPLVLFIQLLASVCPKYRQNRWVGHFELAGKAAGAYPETALS